MATEIFCWHDTSLFVFNIYILFYIYIQVIKLIKINIYLCTTNTILPEKN